MNDLCKNLILLKEYSAFCDKSIDVLKQFERAWDGHVGSIKPVKHQIELEKTENRPYHSVQYLAGRKERALKKPEMNRMRTMDVIEPAQAEWTSPNVLVQNKNGTIHFT